MATRTNPPVTQYKGRDGLSGPLSGALQMISIGIGGTVTLGVSLSVVRKIKFPAGAQFELDSIDVRAESITSDPALTIGDGSDATFFVASVNMTTDLGAVTLKNKTVAAGGTIEVKIVTDAGDKAGDVSLSVYGYNSRHSTALDVRNASHY